MSFNYSKYDDRFDEFMIFYTQNVRTISSKTLLRNLGEIEEVLLDADICWMVSDNMREILAIPSSFEDSTSEKMDNGLIFEKSDDVDTMITFIRDQLHKNKLLIFWQDQKDEKGADHWFTIVGEHGNGHIIEYRDDMSSLSETMAIENVLDLLYNILKGKQPDRFYHYLGKHIFSIWSYDRKPLNVKTIKTYIS